MANQAVGNIGNVGTTGASKNGSKINYNSGKPSELDNNIVIDFNKVPKFVNKSIGALSALLSGQTTSEQYGTTGSNL